METSPRTLSSAQTFLMKVLFPPLWIGGFAIATAIFFLIPLGARRERWSSRS